MKQPSYRPINCSFYDELESAATLKKKVLLGYEATDEQNLERRVIIANLQTTQGEEYLIASDGWQLRLDKIVHIDGKYLQDGYCGI